MRMVNGYDGEGFKYKCCKHVDGDDLVMILMIIYAAWSAYGDYCTNDHHHNYDHITIL